MEGESIKIVDGKIQFEQPKKDDLYSKVSRSIKIKPSKELKNYFKQCFGAYRYFYNKGLYLIKDLYKSQIEKYKKREKEGLCCYKKGDKECSSEHEPINYFAKNTEKNLNLFIMIFRFKR